MKQKAYALAAKLQTDHWWFTGRRRFVRAAMARLPHGPETDVLEVGCGVGANLGWLSDFGRLTALEPDPGALGMAHSQGTAKVLPGSLPDDIPFTDTQFDVVVSLDVLEHVDDHEAALATLHSLTADGGHMVLTVPAYDFLWSSHDALSRHKRRYTMATLLPLLAKAGFEPVRKTYFNTLLFPLSLAAALWDRGGTGKAQWFREHSPLVNGLLKAVFSLESGLASRLSLPFGTTILVIARKNTASDPAAQ